MAWNYKPYHGNDVWIATTDEQKTAAIQEGLRQREYSRTHNHREHKEWYSPTERQRRRGHALAEVCQMITCVGLGLPIVHRPQTFNVPDILPDIQVRLIGEERYGLRVYPKDEPWWRVVGIVIPMGRERDPQHRCPGWFYAGEAKKHPEWVQMPYGPPPMFCVPQEFLRPLWWMKGRLFDV